MQQINPKHLRIGNYVFSDKAYITQVKGINEKEILVNTPFIESIDPIPLAEHWLTKFGFEQDARRGHLWAFDTNSIERDGLIITKGVKGDFYFNSGMHAIKLEFVHTIQNLYFVMSGGLELTFKV